jgi:lambda family phage minor tail protein L
MTLTGHIQGSDLGARVTLYELDLTMFGLGLIRLAPHTDDEPVRAAIGFGGEQYAPHPITADGFELTSAGTLPRPSITVANLDNSFTALVEQNDDLHGGILTRIRTYSRYLDNGPEPDGDTHLPLDIYLLSQKTEHTQEQISWACAALMDQEGVELPGRPIVRDYCDHDVRRWNGVAFDYTNVTCPYVGDPKDVNGLPCAPADEVFSKRLTTCCIARFGANAVLPTRAFPGVARVRNR